MFNLESASYMRDMMMSGIVEIRVMLAKRKEMIGEEKKKNEKTEIVCQWSWTII